MMTMNSVGMKQSCVPDTQHHVRALSHLVASRIQTCNKLKRPLCTSIARNDWEGNYASTKTKVFVMGQRCFTMGRSLAVRAKKKALRRYMPEDLSCSNP